MIKDKKNRISDRDKILIGMEKVYENLIDFKIRSNSDLIVLRNNHIMRIKPKKEFI